MIIVRQCLESDLPALLEIEDECFVCKWKEKDFIYELQSNPVNKMFVAEESGQVIGFIDYMITFNSATISQIGVRKAYRHQGVATMLLRKMYETFPTEGEDIVEFLTLEVRVSNLAALSLYKKNGFEVVTTKRAYYSNGEDAIYMVKRMN